MKRILTPKILQKVVILSILLVGLFFVASGDTVQTVEAARCCSECPGGGDPVAGEEACYFQCGGFNTCYNNCRNSVYSCYAHCSFCSGGGGFDECQFDTQCPPGNFCVNNHCS